MLNKPEQHDLRTLQDVLSDYLDAHGIEMPITMQEVIVKKFFNPDDEFRPICAVQYGQHILCVPSRNLQDIQGFLFWDSSQNAVRYIQLKFNECAEKILDE